MKAPAILMTILLASLSFRALAQDDELGEATGLGTTPNEAVVVRNEPAFPLRWRAYGLLDTIIRRSSLDAEPKADGPNLEVGLALDAKVSGVTSLFFDGRTQYRDATEDVAAVFDQGGLRLALGERWMVAVGKERNRRAPGLIVSPSDQLYALQSAPGLREDRSGVWLGRVSWQMDTQSYDLIALPVDTVKDNGLPDSKSQWLGAVFRSFHRLSAGIDLGLDLSYQNEKAKAGAFLQSFVFKVWKVYGEAGYDNDNQSTSSLVGLGYEGLTDAMIRVEWYKKDRDWASTNMPYALDDSTAILSISWAELWNRFNLSETWLRSLESQAFTNIARAEWVVDDRNLAGLTFVHPEPQKPIRWQALIDWKLSL